MSGFSADWLQRREPFDLAARDDATARRFAAALGTSPKRPLRIVDLAAGSGANFRALAPVLHGDQDWLLIDHDPALIAAQAAAIANWSAAANARFEQANDGFLIHTGSARWHVQARQLDLSVGLDELDLTAYDAVTTTAFLDLVSSAWLTQFCACLTRSQRPLLATLTVDGRRAWSPALPLDTAINTAFQQHQRGDKGFGPALGSTAAGALAAQLAASGYAVTTARSDWQINADDPTMLRQMATEAAAVAGPSDPADAAHIATWSAQRDAQITAGQLSLTIGHLDLLALPA